MYNQKYTLNALSEQLQEPNKLQAKIIKLIFFKQHVVISIIISK